MHVFPATQHVAALAPRDCISEDLSVGKAPRFNVGLPVLTWRGRRDAGPYKVGAVLYVLYVVNRDVGVDYILLHTEFW